jgi:hypothetical protein
MGLNMFRFGYLVLVLISTLGFRISTFAQSETCKWIPSETTKIPFLLDSLSVIEESIQVTDQNNKTYTFSYQINTGLISINMGPLPIADSLLICYRTFPYSFNQSVSNRTLMADYDSMACSETIG